MNFPIWFYLFFLTYISLKTQLSIQVNATLTEAYYQIALLHLTMKNRDLALKFIEKAIEFSPNNLAYQESREKILAL